MTPEEIRRASLPKALRGFDEAATMRLLTDVADSMQSLVSERDRLRRQLEEAETRAGGSDDPTVIGNALLAAQRAGEQLLEQAREAAAKITADADERRHELEREHGRLSQELAELGKTAERQREEIIARARAEADELMALGNQRLVDLRREEETLRSFIEDRRARFIELLQSALGNVERLYEPTSSADLSATLASRLREGAPDVTPSGLHLARPTAETADEPIVRPEE